MVVQGEGIEVNIVKEKVREGNVVKGKLKAERKERVGIKEGRRGLI